MTSEEDYTQSREILVEVRALTDLEALTSPLKCSKDP